MANDWDPLSPQTSTRQTPGFVWPTGSTTPKDVDDQAPIPLIVGIALALFIGFVIIVCCICRRRSLSSSSSGTQESNSAYQRAPTADGNPAPGGGFGAGVGGNSYPMATVNSKYPPPLSQGQPMGMPGQAMTGGMNMGHQQPLVSHQQQQQQQPPYPVLPPNAYTPPYPLGTSTLPAYMPTSHSSHTSSASGPSSDQGPSGFSSSSPPAPAPAPTGMMAMAAGHDPSVTTLGGMMPPSSSYGPPGGHEMGGGAMGTEAVVSSSGVGGTMAFPPHPVQSQAGGYSVVSGGGGFQGQVQGQGMGQGQGQGMGGQGQGMMVHPGFHQASLRGGMMMMGGGGGGGGLLLHGGGGGGYPPPQGPEGVGGQQGGGGGGGGGGMHHPPPTMHHTAMDYVPGGGFVPRVGSPMPPGTTVTELDQL
ncbi:uncharacterized protein LOC143276249 [Babylonia areolata]|uniref:uncharacterized protein LOC143276249 n=1 Tax=Babylonia areolata TaxID=304850 RepID=UPI003FD1DBCB